MDVLTALQRLLDTLVHQDMASLLAIVMVLYGLVRLTDIAVRGARALAKAMPWSRRETVINPVLPIVADLVRVNDRAQENLAVSNENQRLLIGQGEQTRTAISMVAEQNAKIIKQSTEQGTQLQEAMRTLSVAVEALINRTDATETAKGAEAARRQVVVELIQAQTAALAPVVEGINELQKTVADIPPNLTMIHEGIKDLPAQVDARYINELAIVSRERDELAGKTEILSRDLATSKAVIETLDARLTDATRIGSERDAKLLILQGELDRLNALVSPRATAQ